MSRVITKFAFFGGTLLWAVPHSSFAASTRTRLGTTRRVFVILGAVAGLLASAWTLVMPVLAIIVIVGNARATPQDEEAPQKR